MSHTVEIVSQFTDLDLLKSAFQSFGWIVKEAGKIRTYSMDELRDVMYDNVATNPNGKFDLGIKHVNGEYKIFGDFYDRSIAQQLGEELGLLKQKYLQEVVEKNTVDEDLESETSVLEDGTLQIEVFTN